MPQYEYVILDKNATDFNAVAQDTPHKEWFKLGEGASHMIDAGRRDVFMSIGPFSGASLKYRFEADLESDVKLFVHCRGKDRLLVRPIQTKLVDAVFESADDLHFCKCTFRFAISGRIIGDFLIRWTTTVNGLIAMIRTSMMEQNHISRQTFVKLILAEEADGESRATQIKNCDGVRSRFVGNPHHLPALSKARISNKDAIEPAVDKRRRLN